MLPASSDSTALLAAHDGIPEDLPRMSAFSVGFHKIHLSLSRAAPPTTSVPVCPAQPVRCTLQAHMHFTQDQRGMILAARRRYLRAVNPLLNERRHICSLLNQVRPRDLPHTANRASQSAPLKTACHASCSRAQSHSDCSALATGPVLHKWLRLPPVAVPVAQCSSAVLLVASPECSMPLFQVLTPAGCSW